MPFDFVNTIIDDPNVNPTGGAFSTVSSFLNLALGVLMGISIALGTVAIILAGIQYIMSEGDAKAIGTAKRYLTTAILAIVVALLAFTFKLIILNILGSSSPDLENNVPGF
ncbi:MAG: hypothetical protein AAB443_01490 [Patescibacteria group bacterium]